MVSRKGVNIVDRIWLKNYPTGMPTEIDADLFTSVPDLLDLLSAHRGTHLD